MGMYTGLRGWIKIKPAYHEDIRKVVCDYKQWETVIKDLEGVEERDEWVTEARSMFIPHGVVCIPDWPEDQQARFVDGTMTFCCSLKNYCNEIGTFLDLLPLIADAWRLEELYEEHTEVTVHEQGEEQ